MAQNGPRMTQNDPKLPKNYPKWPKNYPKWPKNDARIYALFSQFFFTEKAVPQTFSLLEYMVLEYSYFRILLIAIYFSLEEVMNGVCCFLNLYQSLQGIASVATKGQHYPAQHLPHTFKTLFYLIHNCLFKEQCQMVCCSTETSSVPVY